MYTTRLLVAPGLRIARARRRRGLSQAVLAGLVGRSESWLSQVGRGSAAAQSGCGCLEEDLIDVPLQEFSPGPAPARRSQSRL